MPIRILISIREDGVSSVSALGSAPPSVGYLGPVVAKVCAVLLPPGEYALEVDAAGKVALSSGVIDAARSEEGWHKLREVGIELVDETNLPAFVAG